MSEHLVGVPVAKPVRVCFSYYNTEYHNDKQQMVEILSILGHGQICDLSRKNPSYAFLISLSFNSCQAAILYRKPTSFGNQEEQ